jgi:energy-coupling factor transport system ATP-binding protein
VVITEHHAHRLSTIADRIVRLERGRLVERAVDSVPLPVRVAAKGRVTVEARGVSARFAERPVLRQCSVALSEGTVTALHGDNGAGKSTLLRVLIGLHPVEDGAIVVDGRDVTTMPTEARIPTMGFLPQDAGRRLIHERVADELVDVVRGIGDLEVDRRLRQVVDDLDLAALLGRHPLDLSVGERERVALGAVLMAEPRVILLDEPTRGMDADHRATLVAAIRRRSADGAAVLVATHDPQFAAAIADEHIQLREGVIVDEPVAVGG